MQHAVMESSDAKNKASYVSSVYKLGQDIINACIEMNRIGINQGTSGNISARISTNDCFLITPSGVPYSELAPELLVMIKIDSHTEEPEIVESPFKSNAIKQLAPSTEWRLHRDIYSLKENAKAVVHAHPTYSTVLSCLHLSIPAFHYMIAVAGGSDIRCTPYHTFGTKPLADAIQIALQDRQACLLGNHGMICFSEKSIEKALWLTNEVETLARQYYHVLQLENSFETTNKKIDPSLIYLDENQMAIIKEKFKTYGQSIERK